MNYIITNGSLIVNISGNTYTLNRDNGKFDQAIKFIKAKQYKKLEDFLNTKKRLNVAGFELVDNQILYKKEALPDSLSSRVIEFLNNELPFAPLLKFFVKLKENPSFNSREMLYKFLEHNGHPITSEGNFIAYRGVTDDFKDKHTGKFDNRVGRVCQVKRTEVDDNPNNTCSKGLHVACYGYAKDFASVVVDVEVNPKDVVAVPTDYNGTKMRVCRFKVVAVSKGIVKEPLVPTAYTAEDQDVEYSSSYQEMLNEEIRLR